MSNDKLPPDLAIKVLRAKAAHLEARVQHDHGPTGPIEFPDLRRMVIGLSADIALIATTLADFMEYVKAGAMVWGPQEGAVVVDKNSLGDPTPLLYERVISAEGVAILENNMTEPNQP
jgi:hypothetical protein